MSEFDHADKFKVAHTQYGPFPEGHVFTGKEFARLFPLPDNDATKAAGLLEDGADAYHADLIARALAAGAIVPAEKDAEPGVTPLGPENVVPPPKKKDAPKEPAKPDGEKPADGERKAETGTRQVPPSGKFDGPQKK